MEQLGIETLPINAKNIQKTGEQWEKLNLETRLGTDTVQLFLQQAIDGLLKGFDEEGGRLVIIIDDLDRCSSAAAYRLLEGLKVYLDINNCVFVIGMNQKIVVDAIAKELTHYDDNNGRASLNTIYAEAYLEKLCSSIERLTPPSDTNRLLRDWLAGDHAMRFIDALQAENGESIACLPPNPRRIKALANQINQWLPLLSNLLPTKPQASDKLTYRALLIVAYVYQFHSELFQRWQYLSS